MTKTNYVTDCLKIYRKFGYPLDILPILCGTTYDTIQSYFSDEVEEKSPELNDRIFQKVIVRFPELRPIIIQEVGPYEVKEIEKRNPKSRTAKTFFTADLHFGHPNVIGFDKRPFENVRQMDRELIERWNKVVTEDDLVYILGDLMWKNYHNKPASLISKLNGRKILVRGDQDLFLTKVGIDNLFEKVADYMNIDVELEDGKTKTLILSHYFIPFYEKRASGAIHLHGHTHTAREAGIEFQMEKELNEKGYAHESYNVGCMYWNYEPVTLDTILNSKPKAE